MAIAISEIKFGNRFFLVSPLFIFSFGVFFGFVLLPLILISGLRMFAETNAIGHFVNWNYRPEILEYFFSTAQRYVLALSIFGLALYKVLHNTPKPVFLVTEKVTTLVSEKQIFVFSLTFSIVNFGFQYFSMFPQSLVGLSKTIFCPVQCCLALLLLYKYLTGRTKDWLSVLIIFSSTIFVMIVQHEGKIPAFLLLAGLLGILYVKKFRLRSLITGGLVLSVFAFVGIHIVQTIRYPQEATDGAKVNHGTAAETFFYKVLWRQVETGYCLNNVIKLNKTVKFELSKQGFYFEILVPRILWPEKPNFSLGGEYKTQFCGMPKGGKHSASITILGQPVIKGGMTGMFFHGAALLLLLGGLGIASRYAGAPGLVTILSLLPWWVDFDQDFAMYVGNLVKVSIVIIPIVMISFVVKRNSKRIKAG
tara:strand:- start:534 stop:1796 length:1263 start_codon:yes stop_codon:yes gene_type:complete